MYPLGLVLLVTKSSNLVFRGCFRCLKGIITWVVTTCSPTLLNLLKPHTVVDTHSSEQAASVWASTCGSSWDCKTATTCVQQRQKTKTILGKVYSFKECRIISNNMLCAWLLVWETLPAPFILCVNTLQKETLHSAACFSNTSFSVHNGN